MTIMSNIDKLFNEYKSLLPMKENDQQRLSRKFMLEFNYNSNHIEGNTLTYGQTELLLLFGKVVDAANMKDLEDMKASNVALNMMKEQAQSEYPLTETFIRQLHHTLLREDYTAYRNLPDGQTTSYVVHAGVYKTRPNSVITRTGERFNYAAPEETSALMTDLVAWYNEEEQNGKLTIAELCALFHYRYIRIHPFEDGNGRMARLLMNYTLSRKGYPMIVVKSSDKDNYLNALSDCDAAVGIAPSDGSHAGIEQIRPFVTYIEKCIERALITNIKAARGESIEEDDDFMKELKILELQKKQEAAAKESMKHFSAEEVWNILEFVYFPLTKGFEAAIQTANSIFRFSQLQYGNGLSKTKEHTNYLHVNTVMRGATNPQTLDFVNNAGSMWFSCELLNPQHPQYVQMKIAKKFYISFFDDHYFVDGSMNKNFPYGKYPSEQDKALITSHFKEELLKELKDKL